MVGDEGQRGGGVKERMTKERKMSIGSYRQTVVKTLAFK